MKKTKEHDKSPLEKHVQQQIADFLALDGWRRLRTDPVSDRSRGTGFGEPGMADDLYIRYAASPLTPLAEILWVEAKRPGGTLTQHQKDWHKLERARGALTCRLSMDCEATIEGFVDWYQKNGLTVRRIVLR